MNETELVNVPKPKRRGPLGLLLKWGGFVKFSHTLFAMPFALASMMVASREHYLYLAGLKKLPKDVPPLECPVHGIIHDIVTVKGFPRRETGCADCRLHGLRSDVCDGVQPHC